jgi:hypothetical protein
MIMPGRPPGSQNKDKPFRDALRLELAAEGGDHKALRKVAAALIREAQDGDVNAVKELANRLDGRVAQELAGSEEQPIRLIVTGVPRPERPQ